MTKNKRMRAAHRWGMSLAALVLLAGTMLTLVSTYALEKARQQQEQVQFGLQNQILKAEISRRFLLPVYGMKGARGAYLSQSTFSRSALAAYTGSRNLAVEFPGLLGFGLVEKVLPEDLPEFLRKQQQEYTPADGVDFATTLGQLMASEAREMYLPKYLEPLAKNEGLLGVDLGKSAPQKQAIALALRTGEVVLSRHDSALEKNPYFYLLPIFRKGELSQKTIERANAFARVDAVEGFIYAPLQLDILLSGAADRVGGQLGFSLTDTQTRAAQPFFSTGLESLAQAGLDTSTKKTFYPSYTSSQTLDIGGRQLQLDTASTPIFDQRKIDNTPALLRAGGIGISFLLALAIWLLVTGKARARALALTMTEDLQRLASVARHTSNAVVISDLNHVITWINDGFTRLYGFNKEQALGHTVDALLDRSHPSQTIRTDGSNAGQLEVIDRTRQGREIWVSLEILPQTNAVGEMTGFMAISQDITEKKRASHRLADALNALQHDKEQLNNILEGTHVGTWQWNVKTSALDVNSRWAEMLGYGLQGLAPLAFQTWLDLAHEDDLGRSKKILLLHFQHKRDHYECEMRMRHKAGHWVWVLIRGRVSSWQANGQPLLMAGTQMDISQRKKTDEALKRSNTVMHSIIENMPCGLWVVDADLNILVQNSQLKALLDLPEGLFAVQPVPYEKILRFFANRGDYGAEDLETAVGRRLHLGRNPVVHQFERRRVGGSPVEVMSVPMPGGGFISTYTDISERKKMEQLKGEFIATVSHELRTPLTSIYGSLKMLSSGPWGKGLSGDVQKLIAVSLRNSERLVRLINDVLDIEKIEAGLMRYNKAAHPMDGLLSHAIDTTRHYADQFGVAFCHQACGGQALVWVDADRIAQVLVNLLSNASKFAEKASQVDVSMELLERSAKPWVRVSIANQGAGIPEEFRSRIFGRFSQADGSDQRQKGGTGLGLNICKSIIEAHGGRIDYTSEPGGTTTFYFELPVMQEGEKML